jgi:integrase
VATLISNAKSGNSLMGTKITKRVVDQTVADDKEVWVWDSEVKGFGLRVHPSGRKAYVVEYRPGDGGRKAPKRRYTIGQHGSPWTPDASRSEAQRILGLVRAGDDPAAERVENRHKDGNTVEQLTAAFIEKYAKQNQKSWKTTERVLHKEMIPAFGSKHIADVSRQDIVQMLDKVTKRGAVMANRTLAYVRKFFNWCVERGEISENPCKGLKPPGKISNRTRVLDDNELAEVWQAAEKTAYPFGPIVKLLILTAQRLNEVGGMRWDEVDLKSKTWTLPAERTKNKRHHEVALTDTAVKILRDIPKLDGCPFVFTRTRKTPVSGFSKAKRTIDAEILSARQENDEDATPLPHWTFHDLRRTATTGMARLEVPPHVADAILNHKDGTISGVAAIYNQHAYLKDRRLALRKWEKHVLKQAGPAFLRRSIAFHIESPMGISDFTRLIKSPAVVMSVFLTFTTALPPEADVKRDGCLRPEMTQSCRRDLCI